MASLPLPFPFSFLSGEIFLMCCFGGDNIASVSVTFVDSMVGTGEGSRFPLLNFNFNFSFGFVGSGSVGFS